MKYFFFDIDGTLTNIHTGELVPSALQTLRELEAQGHFVAIATGRAYYKSIKDAKLAGIHNMVSNGGAALVLNDEIIENRPLDKEKALKLLEEAESLGYGSLISYDDSIKVFMKDTKFIDSVGYRQEPTIYHYDPRMSYEDLKDIYKIYIAIPEEKENELTLKDTLGHIRFVDKYLTYQHDSKDKGIERLVTLLGGKPDDIVVFGDGENDMVMFKEEWTCIAMGNGYPPLLEKADFVTKSAEDDGIRYACQHFGWIR